MSALNVNFAECRYQAMLGVGGIGSGMLFNLKGNHTLGREESRSGRLEDSKDYCKLHIISYYVKALLGRPFSVVPIGKVGNDEIGKKLVYEMKEMGLEMDYIASDPYRSTLFSFCFLYPDKSGGNMTTDDSACSSVTKSFVNKAAGEFEKNKSKGIALAVPEVNLEVRKRLLKLGTKHAFFNVASFTSLEMPDVVNSDILKEVDLLSLNIDEASSIVVTESETKDTKKLFEISLQKFRTINPEIKVAVTNGKEGSWVWDGFNVSYFPALTVDVRNTAGAGDAFLSGIIAGVSAGLSLREAQQLGTLVGGDSVTSNHTINTEMSRSSLNKLVKDSGLSFSDKIIKLLKD